MAPARILPALALCLAGHALWAQSAVLYKHLGWTSRDRVPLGANPYGDLQGPAIENRHFALFVSAKEAHIHADMIGKRIPGPQLYRFSKDINRHGGWDWGEDILKVGATLAAGTPALLVNGAIRTLDLAQMDSLVITIPDSSAAHPELRLHAYGWRAGLPAPVDFRWTLRTRLEDRFMEGEASVSPAAIAANVVIAVGVLKAPQANVQRDSARAWLAMMGLPTYFNDSALLAVRSAPPWFRGFLDQEGSVGLRLQPDAQGTVRWTQGGSWIQEPSPVWRRSDWPVAWLPAPGAASNLRIRRAASRAHVPPGPPAYRRLDGRLLPPDSAPPSPLAQ